MPHDITQLRSPTHILITCTCGWRTQIIRKQNALARASKVRSAIHRHYISELKKECDQIPIEDLI
jgi:hypothetical protein